ncbi:hypothetical protein CATRI_07045 [Corynebacterium atrinae]|uniref:YbjN domain-containing protein n=1 Tax=Corynebacterium atrinae TaxID=1336740 RepID=UPI0025B3CF0F|nr:YbjN domain-containing protein [Corynebacterium atrinae]WJY63490.1 hypothetical protein CATRI_07045 [Corynebacterium atrinae]
MSTNSEIQAVTIDRIVEAMRGFDVELEHHPENEVATANLNGLPMTFAVLGSTAIIRADSVTDQVLNDADPTLYLAANQVNCVSFGARATVVDRAETLIVRTERDLSIAAGMTDAQLSASLRDGVDAVLATHDGIKVVAEELSEVRAAVEKQLEEEQG